MSKKLWRGVVALVASFACVVLMSTAAGAVVVNATAVISNQGLRYQNGMNILDVPPGGTGGVGCGTNVDLSFDIDSTSTTGTVVVTDFTSVRRVTVAMTHFIEVITWLSTPAAGNITNSSSSAGADIAGLQVRLRIEYYTPTNTSSTATDCARNFALVCRFNNVNFTLAGTYNANIHTIAASDFVSLTSGAAGIFGLPCNAPFAIYSGGTARFTSLVLHVTSVP